MSKAIVTIVTGDAYTHVWRTKALPSWERYAQRHGYEIIVFDQPLDDSPKAQERSPSWQKLLVLGHPRVAPFERVLWLDADVIVNDAVAPCPVEQTPPQYIGAVRDQALASHPPLAHVLTRINNSFHGTAAELTRYLFENNGLSVAGDYLLNGGVLVLSPQHRELLEHVYHTYQQGPLSYFEQVGLSWELLTHKLHHQIDPRFNLLWLERQALMAPFSQWTVSTRSICMAAALDDCFFLHFAARLVDMAQYDPRVKMVNGGMSVPLSVIRAVAREWDEMGDQLLKGA